MRLFFRLFLSFDLFILNQQQSNDSFIWLISAEISSIVGSTYPASLQIENISGTPLSACSPNPSRLNIFIIFEFLVSEAPPQSNCLFQPILVSGFFIIILSSHHKMSIELDIFLERNTRY